MIVVKFVECTSKILKVKKTQSVTQILFLHCFILLYNVPVNNFSVTSPLPGYKPVLLQVNASCSTPSEFKPRPQGYKTFFFFELKFILLINVKMPTLLAF